MNARMHSILESMLSMWCSSRASGNSGTLGDPYSQLAVMAEDHVLQQRSQSLREVRYGADLVIDHPDPDDDVADQLTFGAVAEAAIIRELVDLADVVQDDTGEQQVEVDVAVVRSEQFRDRAHGQHMLDESAEEGMMNVFGRRRDLEAAGDFRIVDKAFEKRAQRSASDAGDDAAQFA